MSKEYQFGEYKAVDTGYVIKVFKKTLDEFGTFYYRPLSAYQYKDDPTEDKGPTSPSLFHHNVDYALLIKTLLEENSDLKFYNKMDKEIKSE